jgi:hypothetical protein
MIFQVASDRGATIFQGDDVASVEIKKAVGMLNQTEQLLIRLKGPTDYMRQTVVCGGPMA